MKRLMVFGLALLLTTGGGVVQADHGHGNRGWGHKHGGHYKHHWHPRPHYREVHHYSHHRHHHGHHHDHDYYYPLGAALIGAAVTYSIFHTHDNGYSSSRSSGNVVGCHRIERYPDGSERRVEVPIGECY